jgi:phage terminase large subunit GpA-like protein
MSSSTLEDSPKPTSIRESDEATAAKAIRRAWRLGALPPPLLRVSEWAQERRRLNRKEAAEPGPWSNERTPYLVELMDALSWDSPYREVVFMKGAQVGGTEAGNNWLGSSIDTNPGPIMLILPNIDIAKRISKNRLDPLIESTPVLAAKVREQRGRDGGNTRLEKQFPNGVLTITGANSPIGLRSMPARDLIMDELDAFTLSSGDEGDPVFLAERRTSTFQRGKVFKISTPKREGTSRIAAAFAKTDQRYYFVPCPECGEHQVLDWSQMAWDDVGPDRDPEHVYMACKVCGSLIEEHKKTWMLTNGEWRPTAEPLDRRAVGFHLSSLYSPVGWYSWRDAVIAYTRAEREQDDTKRQVFINTVLGLPYAGMVEQPEWRKLFDRRGTHEAGTVPHGGVILTAGMDVQANRIEAEIVAWGRRFESWSIDYIVLDGDTTKAEVWGKLYELMSRDYPHASGASMPIRAMGIDTGYRTQAAYAFAARFPQPLWSPKGVVVAAPRTCIAMKGRDDETSIVLSARRIAQQRKASMMRLYTIGVSYLKEEFYGWLRQEMPTPEEAAGGALVPAGFAHFPDYHESYFRGLTAERRLIEQKNGRMTTRWVKDANMPNEPLDCRLYARAAAAMLGIDRFSDENWDAMEAPLLNKSVKSIDDVLGRPVNSRINDPYLSMG